MSTFFFRNGMPYTGTEAARTFKPAKGEAWVRVYPRCVRCSGAGEHIGGGHMQECRRCNGSGHELRTTSVRVYTSARLAELNRRYGDNSTAAIAAREATREYRLFVRQRADLLAEIEECAPHHETLAAYRDAVNDGTILTPTQIRHAKTLLHGVRAHLAVK